MNLVKNVPFWVACFVAATGLFFSIVTLTPLSAIQFAAPNAYFLTVVAVILFIAGGAYALLALKGGLKKQGVTVTEVRKKALEKINSEAYLAKVAQEDPDPEVRQVAIQRLEKIAD
jgi:hypothetical protein